MRVIASGATVLVPLARCWLINIVVVYELPLALVPGKFSLDELFLRSPLLLLALCFLTGFEEAAGFEEAVYVVGT